MAERRMFARTIIDSDAFLDMPLSTQALYFHLSMRADDDGFINNPKKIQRVIGCSDDDLKLLFAKNFVIAFESGVVVIKHWKIHNYLRNDRYKPTVYADEKAMLVTKENGAYTIAKDGNEPLGIPNGYQMDTNGIPNGYQMETQDRLGKVNTDKDSIGEVIISDAKPPKRFVRPTIDEVKEYCKERGNNVNPEKWYAFYEANGWKIGRNAMKDWKASVRYWESEQKGGNGGAHWKRSDERSERDERTRENYI